MTQLPTPNHPTRTRERHARTRKNTPTPRRPARQITQHAIPPLGRQLIDPKVLPARIRHRARQLAQAHTHTYRDEAEEDDAINDEDGPAAVDTRDEGGGNGEPGVCEGEGDGEDGEDGEVAFEGRVVAHGFEGEGVGIEGGGGGFEGGGGGFVL